MNNKYQNLLLIKRVNLYIDSFTNVILDTLLPVIELNQDLIYFKKEMVLSEVPNDEIASYLIDAEYKWNSIEAFMEVVEMEKTQILNYLNKLDLGQDPRIVLKNLLDFLNNLIISRVYHYQLSSSVYRSILDEYE